MCVRLQAVQTSCHRIFVSLAVCAFGCTQRPKHPATVAPAVAPTAKVELPTEPEPPKRKKMTRETEPVVGAPRIQFARFTSPNTVSLHFNEPVVVTEGFDPRQFRLSLGSSYDDEDGSSTVGYYDPAAMEDPELTTTFLDTTTESELTIRLVLSQPMDSYLCKEASDLAMEAAKDSTANGGFFLHYRDRPESGIEDTDGNRLRDIAPQWVERGASSAAAYAGQQLGPIAAVGPIPCSF